MAFTSDLREADSDTDYSIEIQSNGVVRIFPLYDRSGNDYLKNKGDLWDFMLTSSENCMTIAEIERVSVVENGDDDWNIETIVTLVSDVSSNKYQVLTHDFEINRWISNNYGAPAHRRFNLSFTGKIHYTF